MNKGLKKGQMFLIAAIIIITGLIMLKSLFSVYSTAEERRYEDSDVTERELENIRDSYENLLGTSTFSDITMRSEYLYNLSSFVREKDTRILYVVVYSNGTLNYTVLAGNFLKEQINLTINSTNSSYKGVLNDKANMSMIFQGNDKNISISYTKQNQTINETLLVITGRNYTAGLFDITISEERISVRTKDVFNITW